MKKITVLMLAVGMIGVINLLTAQMVFADCVGVPTGTVNCESNNGVTALLGIVLNVITFGVGVAGTIGFVLAGYQYMTATDSPAKVVQAKERMMYIVIGLVMYAVLWTFLQFLMPGNLEQNLQKIETVETPTSQTVKSGDQEEGSARVQQLEAETGGEVAEDN